MENFPRNPEQQSTNQPQNQLSDIASRRVGGNYKRKLFFSLLIAAILAILLSRYLALAKWRNWWPFNPDDNQEFACTMEVKQCPDGSYVGRTGPACEFAVCPGEVDTSDWRTYRNEEYGFEVKYPENLFFNSQLRATSIGFSENGISYSGVYLGEMTNGCSLLVYKSKENPFITEYYQGDTAVSTLIANYKKVFNKDVDFFVGLSAASRAVDPSNCMDSFDQILSTFKFNESGIAPSPLLTDNSKVFDCGSDIKCYKNKKDEYVKLCLTGTKIRYYQNYAGEDLAETFEVLGLSGNSCHVKTDRTLQGKKSIGTDCYIDRAGEGLNCTTN